MLNSTKNYVEESYGDEQECKIQTEYAYIKSMLYHSCIRESSQLVIVLEHDVNPNDIPTELKGLPYCLYPKRLKIPEDENSRKLIGLLLDIEPLQIVTEFKPKKRQQPPLAVDDIVVADGRQICEEMFV